MKECCKCNNSLEVIKFGKNKHCKDGLQKWCKDCRNAHQRGWYKKFPTVQKIRVANTKHRLREYITNQLVGKCCVDCSETNIVVLEFDHRGSKLFNIADAAPLGKSLTKVKQEIAKCEIRCANCHRIKTAKDCNSYKYRKYLETCGNGERVVSSVS